MQAPCWEATDFVLNLRSVLNKYPLGTQPCAYNYSDGKDYKKIFCIYSLWWRQWFYTDTCLYSVCVTMFPPTVKKANCEAHDCVLCDCAQCGVRRNRDRQLHVCSFTLQSCRQSSLLRSVTFWSPRTGPVNGDHCSSVSGQQVKWRTKVERCRSAVWSTEWDQNWKWFSLKLVWL